MILQKEIRKFSKKWDIPQDTVDKDYVLGHFLSEIYQHFEDKIIFKGGTCLRKCYFPDYRFSEDLDFTARSKTFTLKNKSLKDIFKNAVILSLDNIIFSLLWFLSIFLLTVILFVIGIGLPAGFIGIIGLLIILGTKEMLAKY